MARDKTRRARLRDVAERAGVSVGSASNTFGRPELVSEDVRQRVLAAAKEIGYAGPDPSGRRLRLGRAGALGVIFSERLRYQFTDPAAPAFFTGLADGMEGSNLGLLLLPDTRFREAAAQVVHAAAVDGFVIYSAVRDPRVEAALARQVPVVTVDQPRDAPTPFVGIDDQAAARSVAEYIRELGHELVGVVSFVSAIDEQRALAVDLSVERLDGYREGLGPAWDEDRVRPVRRNDVRHARRAALDLIDGPRPPTAILAMSDVLALGVLQAAAERGLAVPAQLSVAGFDDSPAASLAYPTLTTVAQPHEEKGRVAAEWLVRDVERGSVTRTRRRRAILPTQLVVRNSTAPPPQQARKRSSSKNPVG